jgi:hypothetical protein
MIAFLLIVATILAFLDTAFSRINRRYWVVFLAGQAFSPVGTTEEFASGGRPVESKETFWKGGITMKSRNLTTDPQNMLRGVQPDVTEERGNKGPSPTEIRRRAFEIHIERGGIHGCDLDDWMQAERELLEKYTKSNDGGSKKKWHPYHYDCARQF